MDRTKTKIDENPVVRWIKDNKKPLIIIGVIAGFMIVNQYYHRPFNNKFNEYDLLSKGPIDKVNEHREKIRILHSQGVPGMWDKLTWIDKVISGRPENISNRNYIPNLPPREHGWNLYKKD